MSYVKNNAVLFDNPYDITYKPIVKYQNSKKCNGANDIFVALQLRSTTDCIVYV